MVGPVTGGEVLDLAYAPGDDPKQRLDLFLPAAPADRRATPAPVAVFVHGGVWAMGDRKEHANVGRAFAAMGCLAAVMSYRLAPAAMHPAQIEDVASAVNWLVAHAAEHGGDPCHILLAGHSAGAHLVMLLAWDPSWWQARDGEGLPLAGLAALSGIFDLAAPFGDVGQDTGKDYVARVFGPDTARWRDASPLMHLATAPAPILRPPVLLVMAEHDYPGIRTQTAHLAGALRAAGGEPVVADIPDRGHDELVARIGSDGDPTTAALSRWVAATTAAPSAATGRERGHRAPR
jgi:acetyl esterase/lipase